MKVVFFGFQTWGYESLRPLLTHPHHQVSLVVTHPESSHPYECIWNDSVAELARGRDIEVVTAREGDEPAVLAALARHPADVLLASDWRSHLSTRVLSHFPRGGINVHDGLLPRYGGFAPINWAIANGEPEIGVTAHEISDGFDLGPIIVQRRLSVGPDETATQVARRVFGVCREICVDALQCIDRTDFRPRPQDAAEATFFHKRGEREGRIDWTWPARRVYDLIRAQSDPYPNAHARYRGRRLLVKRAQFPTRAYCGTPGRVLQRSQAGALVLCGKGRDTHNQGLWLTEVQASEGGVAVPATHLLQPGSHLD